MYTRRPALRLGCMLVVLIAALLPQAARADVIVNGPTLFNNGGAGYSSGSTGTFTFPQFNTLGGTRTLSKVTLTLDVTSTGGAHTFDNETASPATITLGIGANVRVKAPIPAIGSQLIVITDAEQTLTGPITADTDGVPADLIGTDALTLTGTTASNTNSAFRTAAGDLVPYIGAGLVSFDWDGVTSTLATGVLPSAGLNAVTAPTFVFSATLTYEFVPEPALLSVFTIALLPILRRSGRRSVR